MIGRNVLARPTDVFNRESCSFGGTCNRFTPASGSDGRMTGRAIAGL